MKIFYLIAAAIWLFDLVRFLIGNYYPSDFTIGLSMFLSMTFFVLASTQYEPPLLKEKL